MSLQRSFLIGFCLIISSITSNAVLNKNGKNVCLVQNSKYEELFEKCLDKDFFYQRHECLMDLKKNEKVAICCEGYKEINNACEPSCTNCGHGFCIAPEKCDCMVNFRGAYCNETCPSGSFGQNCENQCSYLTNSKLNENYTECECSSKNLSDECKKICKCRTTLCPPGFIGKNCKTSCPANTFGNHCSQNCSCEQNNTISCNKEDGFCRCKANFYGSNCEYECTEILSCQNNSTLNCNCSSKFDQKTKDFGKKLCKVENVVDFTKIILFVMVFIIFGLMFLVYKSKVKTIKLNTELGAFKVKYSNTPIEFNDLLNESNLNASITNNNQKINGSTDRSMLKLPA